MAVELGSEHPVPGSWLQLLKRAKPPVTGAKLSELDPSCSDLLSGEQDLDMAEASAYSC